MKEPSIISCKIAARLICKSFERRLTAREQAALKAHLAICRTCVYCLRQLKALRKIFPQYTRAVVSFEPAPEACLPDAAKQRLRAALKPDD